jgi:NTE family protein
VTAVVLSGGGERVVAWQNGVLAGLADAGLDLRTATIAMGTSAGALVAARLAAGIDPRADARTITPRPSLGGVEAFDVLAGAWRAAGATTTQRRRAFGHVALARSPGGEDAFVASVARRFSHPAWPPALRVVAIDAQSGERVVFDRDAGVSPARAIAASRAIPTLFPPVTVGGRPFIDGALGSATNADALAGADVSLVLVITAVPAERVEHGPERSWQEALEDEVSVLESAGHRVVVVHPLAAERAAMGEDPMSGATADVAAAAGRRRGRSLARQISPRLAA